MAHRFTGDRASACHRHAGGTARQGAARRASRPMAGTDVDRQAAGLCISAGADMTLIARWVDKGRRRAAAAASGLPVRDSARRSPLPEQPLSRTASEVRTRIGRRTRCSGAGRPLRTQGARLRPAQHAHAMNLQVSRADSVFAPRRVPWQRIRARQGRWRARRSRRRARMCPVNARAGAAARPARPGQNP